MYVLIPLIVALVVAMLIGSCSHSNQLKRAKSMRLRLSRQQQDVSRWRRRESVARDQASEAMGKLEQQLAMEDSRVHDRVQEEVSRLFSEASLKSGRPSTSQGEDDDAPPPHPGRSGSFLRSSSILFESIWPPWARVNSSRRSEGRDRATSVERRNSSSNGLWAMVESLPARLNSFKGSFRQSSSRRPRNDSALARAQVARASRIRESGESSAGTATPTRVASSLPGSRDVSSRDVISREVSIKGLGLVSVEVSVEEGLGVASCSASANSVARPSMVSFADSTGGASTTPPSLANSRDTSLDDGMGIGIVHTASTARPSKVSFSDAAPSPPPQLADSRDASIEGGLNTRHSMQEVLAPVASEI